MKASLLAPLLAALLSFTCASVHAEGANGDASAPSRLSTDASATVIGGSLLSVAVAGSVVVLSVAASAEGVVLVLKGAGEASTATVRLSGEAARAVDCGRHRARGGGHLHRPRAGLVGQGARLRAE